VSARYIDAVRCVLRIRLGFAVRILKGQVARRAEIGKEFASVFRQFAREDDDWDCVVTHALDQFRLYMNIIEAISDAEVRCGLLKGYSAPRVD
jgi:hypothetical protein